MNTFGIKTTILLLLFQSSLSHAIDTVKVNEKDALFSALNQTLPIITTSYIGWEKNWKWAGAIIQPTHSIENNQYKSTDFNGQIKNLNIKFNGSVVPNKNNLVWNYNWEKSSPFPNAIGFGIEFKLELSHSSHPPKLLPNNIGWRWETASNESFEVVFNPAPKKIYFERGKKNNIRVLFFSDITVGSQSSTMTITVGNKVKMSGPDSITYDAFDSSWHKDIISPLSSPIDLSFLNENDKPAGKQGFIKRKNDQLFFENGTPAKFWGANIQASALFNTPDFNIKRHAKRIAQLGFNLIRIHHHDSSWVNPNIFKNQNDNTLELSDSALNKIDWWIKCLKDEGVYLWLDLHVGRRFTENDGINNFSDFSKGKSYAEAKGFNYYNKDVQTLMQAFNEAYLSHVNPYTQLAYKDDPAVIALLITNENDLTQHFGNSLLANKNVPIHHAIFSKDVQEFSSTFGLSKHKVGATWQLGESKIYLNDVEHRFNQQMIAHLDGLGVKSLVSTTNSWGRMGLFGLPSLTDGSLIDAHAYGRAEEFKLNPRYTPGFLTWPGATQVTGYPLSITEWNIEPFPAKDRFTTPTFVASIASLQGWDAIMLYGYSQNTLSGKGHGSNYSSYNDPAMVGLMPAAAILYRQNHVLPAKESYELKLNRDYFFFKRQDPTTSKTIRTLLETSRLTIAMPQIPELPWLNNNGYANGAIVIHDANRDFIPTGQNFVESDTGELKRDWEKGIHTIDTEKSQVASGWIGGESIDLTDVTFKIETKNAIVAVQSLDNKSIRNSQNIFITVMARSKPGKDNKLPFLSEPVTGQLDIYASKGLKLFPINRLGKPEDNIAALQYSEGKYNINLSSDMKYHWFVLQNTPPLFENISPEDGTEYVKGDLKTFKKYFSQQENNKASSPELFKDRTKSDARGITLSLKESPFRITSPHNGDVFIEGNPIVIKTNASKWAGTIKRVDFWKDNWKYLANDTKKPYEHTINNLSAGKHILRTRLIYTNGKKRDSKITITIEKNNN